jgi:hypothetical protein
LWGDEHGGVMAARFIKSMEEDKPSEWLVANLQKGRELLENMNECRTELKSNFENP